MKQDRYPTIKIWHKTRHMLRIISAKRMMPMVELLDELVQTEWNRIQLEGMNVSNERFKPKSNE